MKSWGENAGRPMTNHSLLTFELCRKRQQNLLTFHQRETFLKQCCDQMSNRLEELKAESMKGQCLYECCGASNWCSDLFLCNRKILFIVKCSK